MRRRTLLALFAAMVLAAGLLALVEANPARAVELNFAPAQNYPVGSSPVSVTTAHFNDDGEVDFVDLVVSNHNTNTVSVLLGSGDGTLQAKQDFEVGTSPRSGTSADFDEDGNADLAVAVSSPFSNIAVLLGNGDGTFQTKRNVPVGSGPTSVASADFNADGNADLAVTNSGTHNVSVLLGNGDGSFQAAQNYSVSVAGSSPHRIITVDINADGEMDLATANIGSDLARFPGGVAVLLGKGDGTFQDARKVLDHFFTNSVTAADFNGDGKMDLAATGHGCCGGGEVSVALGNGDGTFQAAQRFRVGSGHTIPTSVTSAYLDRDEKIDLAVSNSDTDNVSVFPGNGDGSFQTAQDLSAGDNPAFVTGADLNADGSVDLTVPNQNSNNVSVLLNRTVDTTAPTVGSVSPADGETGVALTASVEAIFSETMDPSTITDQTFTLIKEDSSNPMPARVIYDSAQRKATLYPAITLEADTSYTATIKGGSSGAKDLAGNALAADKVWTFSTVDTIAPPAPIITSPPNNTIDNDGNFTVSGTAEAGTTVELFEGSASKDTARANTSGQWSINLTGVSDGSHSYTAKATDAAGNVSAESETRTVIVDATKPTVSRVVPAANATGIAPGANVAAVFSEAMKSSSISANTFKLYKKGSTTVLAATVTYDAGIKRAVLNPSANLQRGATYKAVVSTGVRDLAGNQLDQNPTLAGNQQKVWFFTVRN